MSDSSAPELDYQSWQFAPDGAPARVFTIRNQGGSTARICDYGATLLSLQLVLADGELREVVLGCDQLEDYLNQSSFLGATVGRFANRIAGASLERAGKTYTLNANEGDNCLHGGAQGFDKKRWTVTHQSSESLTLELVSSDGDQGFPGECKVKLTYRISEKDQLTLDYHASVDQECPVNLTNHSYFNLDGIAGDIGHHSLSIDADQYLPVNAQGLPESEPVDLSDTAFDFRTMKDIRSNWREVSDDLTHRGYDHSYILNQPSITKPFAHAVSSDNLVEMKVYTTKPAVQLYTGQYLQGTMGHKGLRYQNRDGFCLETQFLPDSPANPQWHGDVWLKPGQAYRHQTCYEFITR
ncbi:galactose-1-epimerase [Alginatibacterium sediminis]|uniref:Aldose 1-epimerase n=1 Tax=Alginatibacterium sediminis TaxID=2164068 RepID=A0A420EAY5_9ALTE|nr:galactose-1-epimerase [Alginatibacterium sediminis]RKF17840.1 galactose-1-epimerase [Alginatibacterium sediminis]